MWRIAVVIAFGVATHAAYAAPFNNGGFEGCVGNVFDVPAGSTLIPGWTVSVGTIDWEGPPPGGWAPSQGSCSIDLVGQAVVGGISQTFDTVAGTAYQVSFDLAGNFGALPTVKPLSVTVAGTTHDYSFDTTGKTASNMGWTRQTFTFVATGSSTTINFVSDLTGQPGPGNAGAAIDNVAIAPAGTGSTTNAIPLDWAQWAAAVALLLMGLAFLRRRV